MRNTLWGLLFLLLLLNTAHAQGTVPIFQQDVAGSSYAVAGHAPAPVSTIIPTILVPVILSFDSKMVKGKSFVMDASRDVPRILASPVFSSFAFPVGGTTQYADAMLRASFAAPDAWHTLLGKPDIKPVRITVPSGYGYVLTSKASGKSVQNILNAQPAYVPNGTIGQIYSTYQSGYNGQSPMGRYFTIGLKANL
jgi:chitinase